MIGFAQGIVASLILVGALDTPAERGADGPGFQACGPNCLYMVCVAKGVKADFYSLMKSFKLGPEGETTLSDLRRVGASLGLRPIAAKVDAEFATTLPSPFIAHVKSRHKHADHFVTVLSSTEQEVIYVDPPNTAVRESVQSFGTRWTGSVLVFADSAAEARSLTRRIVWSSREPLVQAALGVTLVVLLVILWRVASRPVALGN